MEYTQLGRSGLTVSRLCLGTVNFCYHDFMKERDCHRIMSAALDHGLTFFDTARDYGDSEDIIGRWFGEDQSRRDKIVLATKFGGGGDLVSSSAKTMKIAVEQSLKKLKTDYIDLYQIHHIDRRTPWEEVFQAFEQLVTAGKVLYFGSSNYAGWNIAHAAMTAKQRHFMGFISEQSIYNLNARYVELEVLPACQAFGLGFLPYCPIGGGTLGGILGKVSPGRRASVQKEILSNPEKKAQFTAYEKFCRKRGIAPALVALAWLLKQPVVAAPIVGSRTVEQLNETLGALSVALTDADMLKLDEIWPAPWKNKWPGKGKQAPEAYGW